MDKDGLLAAGFVLGVILLIGIIFEVHTFQASKLVQKMAGLGYIQIQCIGSDSKIWVESE